MSRHTRTSALKFFSTKSTSSGFLFFCFLFFRFEISSILIVTSNKLEANDEAGITQENVMQNNLIFVLSPPQALKKRVVFFTSPI